MTTMPQSDGPPSAAQDVAYSVAKFRAAGTPVPARKPTTVICPDGPLSLQPASDLSGVLAAAPRRCGLGRQLVAPRYARRKRYAHRRGHRSPRGTLPGSAIRSHVPRLQGLGTKVAVGVRHQDELCKKSPPMSSGRRLATVILLVLITGLGCNTWRGPGFRPDGPEMRRLREVMTLGPGMSVADVGAGRGELTVALAAEVGPSGHVFSTDIDPQALEQIRTLVVAAALQNVTVVQAAARDTGLPRNCCDAVVLRRVYHHLSDPAATNVGLLRAVRPGGVLAVIDFPPTLSWLWPWPPKGVPRNRNGHGVAARLVVDEVTVSGFELVKVIDDWPGRGPLESYCAVFRNPRAADARLTGDGENPVRLKDREP
jgi:SAM-dependent methyltransferase